MCRHLRSDPHSPARDELRLGHGARFQFSYARQGRTPLRFVSTIMGLMVDGSHFWARYRPVSAREEAERLKRTLLFRAGPTKAKAPKIARQRERVLQAWMGPECPGEPMTAASPFVRQKPV